MSEKPKREFRVHRDFAAADEAEYAYYRSLSGNEKLKLMLEIMAPAYEANPRFERVYRVVEFPRGGECATNAAQDVAGGDESKKIEQ